VARDGKVSVVGGGAPGCMYHQANVAIGRKDLGMQTVNNTTPCSARLRPEVLKHATGALSGFGTSACTRY
jgi:hypothetical protein